MYYLKRISAGRWGLDRLASYTSGLGRASRGYRPGLQEPGVAADAADTEPEADLDGSADEQFLAALLASAYPRLAAPPRFAVELGAYLERWHRLTAAENAAGDAARWRQYLRARPGQADLLFRGGALVGALSVVGLFWLGRTGRPL